ncbi:alginate export family protein [bacterium]|nr:alginate export family protein [bacterium]
MKKLCCVFCLLLLFSSFLMGLDEKNLKRQLEERRRNIMASTEKKGDFGESKKGSSDLVKDQLPDYNSSIWEWGGYNSFSYLGYVDDDKSSTTIDTLEDVWDIDTRLWLRGTFRGRNTLYMRVKNNYDFYNWGDGIVGNSKENEGPHIDMLYHKWRFDTGELTIGRHYMSVGRGIAYADTHDGVTFIKRNRAFTLKLLGSKTKDEESNIDRGSPDIYQDREFYGAQGTLSLFGGKHNLYGFGVMSKDKTLNTVTATQAYEYNAKFYGIGANGTFFKNSNYWIEYVGTGGDTYSAGQTLGSVKDSINAWALTTGGMYFFKGKTKPYIVYESAYGSGDMDKGITDASGVNNLYVTGNTVGTKDESFHSFGYYDVGAALGADLSNLKVHKIAFYFKPLGENKYYNDLTTGFKYSIYKKMYAQSAISDYYSDQLDRDIGSGLDFYLTWQLIDDLNLYVNYSIFKPGDAYPVNRRDTDKYLLTTLTLSF